MGTIDKRLEGFVDHNFPIMMSEEKDELERYGMMHFVKQKFTNRQFDPMDGPEGVTPCISADFFYDPKHATITNFVENFEDGQHDDTFGRASYKLGYKFQTIGKILAVEYSGEEAHRVRDVKDVLQESLIRFNENYDAMLIHAPEEFAKKFVCASLLQNTQTKEQHNPFTESRAKSALGHLNETIRKYRNQASASQ